MSSSKRWAGKLRHKSPCAKAGASSMGSLAVLAIATLSIATAFGGNSDCPACKRISSSNSMGPDWAGLYHLQVYCLEILGMKLVLRTLEICAVRWTVVFTGNHALKSLWRKNLAIFFYEIRLVWLKSRYRKLLSRVFLVFLGKETVSSVLPLVMRRSYLVVRLESFFF